MQPLYQYSWFALSDQHFRHWLDEGDRWIRPYSVGFGGHVPLFDTAEDALAMYDAWNPADIVLVYIAVPLRHLRDFRTAGAADRAANKWRLFTSLDCYDYHHVHCRCVEPFEPRPTFRP